MGYEGVKKGPETKIYPPGTHAERAENTTVALSNTVVWANTNINAPFKFEVGESSPLGIMFDVAPEKRSIAESALVLRTREQAHGRSADIGSVYFKDPDGRLYRDIDIKGAGMVLPGGTPVPWKLDSRDPEASMLGLMDKEDALHDSEMAERFTELGIRTHRSLAVIALNELEAVDPKTGEVRLETVEALRDEKKIAPDFDPVVQIRAFGTKSRLRDMDSTTSFQELEDTLALVRLETGGAVTNIPTYMTWFTERLAENIARMHAGGYLHAFLTAHNVTLDARLVDFDSVTKRPEDDVDPVIPEYETVEEEINAPPPPSAFWDDVSRDFHQAVRTLRWHYQAIRQHFPEETAELDEERIIIAFEKMYLKEYPNAVLHLRW